MLGRAVSPMPTVGCIRFSEGSVGTPPFAPDPADHTYSHGWAVVMTDVRRSPTPVTDTWDWPMRAACRDRDAAIFFHPDRERGPAHARRERQAKQVCAECPVRAQCRAHALSVGEPYGVWGGLSESDRLAISCIPTVDADATMATTR